MPELAEVAYACSLWNKGLKKSIKQVEIKERTRVFRDTDVRKFVEFLEGTTLLKSATHGKQMLFSFSNKIWIGIHLGMTGSLQYKKPTTKAKNMMYSLLDKPSKFWFSQTQDNSEGFASIREAKNPLGGVNYQLVCSMIVFKLIFL